MLRRGFAYMLLCSACAAAASAAGGGKQVFRAFDPLGIGLTVVTIQAVGDTVFTVADGPREPSPEPAGMTHFRYYTGASFAADVFVGARGDIRWIDASPAELAYVLPSRVERAGNVPPRR